MNGWTNERVIYLFKLIKNTKVAMIAITHKTFEPGWIAALMDAHLNVRKEKIHYR